MRRSRHHIQKTENHGKIVGAVSISESDLAPEKMYSLADGEFQALENSK